MNVNSTGLDNKKLDDIALALRNYATLLTTEAERQEIFNGSNALTLFERAGAIWGLSEDVEACKTKIPKTILQFKSTIPKPKLV